MAPTHRHYGHLALLTLATLAGAALRLLDLNRTPPGLHYDLAATALLASDIAFQGARPVFITAYTGHEVLFSYWLAAIFRLIGSSVFALRLAAAWLGILAIPCTYFAVRQVCAGERNSRWVAILAAVLLSFAFFHVVFSRFGFRVISQPITQSLALGFLWRGLRQASGGRGARTSMVLAGAFTGLTAHTYLAARLFPFPIAIALLALLLFAFLRLRDRRPADDRLSPGRLLSLYGIFIVVAAIVVAPLAWFFVQHPEALTVRASQVAPRAGEADLIWTGIRRAAEMLFINGEAYDRFNLPGRPLFGPWLGVCFVVGLAVTLRRVWRQRAAASGRGAQSRAQEGPGLLLAAEVLLLAWLPLMLIPTALAVHDIFPSNVRAFGEIPLLFVFPARGLLALVDGAQRLVRGRLRRFASFGWIAGGALAMGTVSTAYAYFGVWARLPNQYLNNDGDLVAIAAWLNGREIAEPTYVSSFHYRHPTLAYLARDYSKLSSIYQAGALPIPSDQPARYVFPRSARPPEEWLRGWEAYQVAAPLGPDGSPDFWAYEFSSGASVPLPNFTTAESDFGHVARLTGYAVRRLEVGGTATLDLRWQVLNPPPVGDYRAVVDWVDAWGFHWSQALNDAYPSEQWRVGDTLLQRLAVPLPPGLPPGEYWPSVTLFSPSTQQIVPLLNAQGEFAGAAARLGPVEVPLDATRQIDVQPEPAVRLDMPTGTLRLLGIDPPQASLHPGERLNLALYWEANATPTEDYLVRITLRSAGDTLVLSETHPVHGSFPTSRWTDGMTIVDRYSIPVPRDFAPGTVELLLDLLDSGQQVAGRAALGLIEIQPLERTFELPQAAHLTKINLGDQVALVGFDLEPESPAAGQTFALTLYWQALRETDRDYTAFVHVLDSDGNLVAQHDAQPREDAYPTSWWIVDEVVADRYTFQLPSGEYAIEVGFYLPEDGTHLGRAAIHRLIVA